MNIFALSVLSFVSAAVSTYALIAFSGKINFLARPTPERWHKKATPILGGVGIYLGFLVGIGAYLLLGKLTPLFSPKGIFPITQPLLVIIVSGSVMLIVGLIDDIMNIRPYTKLLWQLIVATAAVSLGIHIEIINNQFVSFTLTILWFVGITNAINLLDNMDGLAGGIVLISLLSFAAIALGYGNTEVVVVSSVLAASVLGFLCFNFNPAKIFMGDAGSMFLGHSVAALSLLGTWESASNVLATLLVPALLLAVPIFDTLLVSINRTLSGRKVTQGGRDHSSHRLVSLGLSERSAVFVLLTIAAMLSAVAGICVQLESYYVMLLAVVAVVGFIVFGVYLSDLKIYQEVESFQSLKRLGQFPILTTFIYFKKQIFEVLVDASFLFVAYVLAYLIRFDGSLSDDTLAQLISTVPLVMLSKLCVLAVINPYGTDWRYIGAHELLRLFRAVAVGAFLSLSALFVFSEIHSFTPSIIIIDAMLSLFLLSGYRFIVRAFDEFIFSIGVKQKRLLIIGARGSGEAFIRSLKLSRSGEYFPVGYLDSEDSVQGRSISGVRVLGRPEELGEVLANYLIDEVMCADSDLDAAVYQGVVECCHAKGVTLVQISPPSTSSSLALASAR